MYPQRKDSCEKPRVLHLGPGMLLSPGSDQSVSSNKYVNSLINAIDA